MKKWIIGIIVLILVVGGGTWYYQKGKAKQVTTTIIPTATVQKGTIVSDVSGSGSLSPSVDEDVKSSISDTIYTIEVSEGQKVKKGQALIEYNNGTYLYAPDGGTVTSIAVYANTRVNIGEVVAHITNYDDLNTTVSVDELDIPEVKVGQPVNVVVNAYPDNKYSGKVASIAQAGSVSNGVSSFDVTVQLTSSSGLKAGMTTTADIITNKKDNALFIPVEAVHKMGNHTFVLVEKAGSNSKQATTSQNGSSNRPNRWMSTGSGNATRVEVKTGIHNDSDVEILSGLTVGQIVELPPIVRGNTQSQNQNGSQFGPGMFRGGFGGGFGGGGGQRRMNNGSKAQKKGLKN